MATGDTDARSALESLDRELDFRKETSIRQRVRQLVRAEFSELSTADRTELEREAVEAYDGRGTLTHTGYLPDAKLDDLQERSFRIVRQILAKRLGIDL